MLRQTVLNQWNKLKEKIISLDNDASDVPAYRNCIIIMEGVCIEPVEHNHERALRLRNSISKVITNDSSVDTGLPLEVNQQLYYIVNVKQFWAPQMVILTGGRSVEVLEEPKRIIEPLKGFWE